MRRRLTHGFIRYQTADAVVCIGEIVSLVPIAKWHFGKHNLYAHYKQMGVETVCERRAIHRRRMTVTMVMVM